MKLITTAILLFLLPYCGLTQETTIESSLVINADIQHIPIITEVGKYNASPNLTVYTYKLNNGFVDNSQQKDSDLSVGNSEQIQSIITIFLTVQGISECTYDNPTQSFTLLVDPNTDLSKVVNSINKN
jgi:hypothetical protein